MLSQLTASFVAFEAPGTKGQDDQVLSIEKATIKKKLRRMKIVDKKRKWKRAESGSLRDTLLDSKEDTFLIWKTTLVRLSESKH